MHAKGGTLRLSPGEFRPLPFPSDLLVTRSGEPSGIRTAWLLAISLFFVVPGPLSLGCRQLPCCCFFSFLSFAFFWQAALCYLVVLLPQRHTGFEHMLVLLVVTREWLLDFGFFLQVLHVFFFVAALCDFVVLPPQCHAGVEHMLELLVMARKWLR